jgi:hypothetical protein
MITEQSVAVYGSVHGRGSWIPRTVMSPSGPLLVAIPLEFSRRSVGGADRDDAILPAHYAKKVAL